MSLHLCIDDAVMGPKVACPFDLSPLLSLAFLPLPLLCSLPPPLLPSPRHSDTYNI